MVEGSRKFHVYGCAYVLLHLSMYFNAHVDVQQTRANRANRAFVKQPISHRKSYRKGKGKGKGKEEPKGKAKGKGKKAFQPQKSQKSQSPIVTLKVFPGSRFG